MELDKKGGVFANIFCIYFFNWKRFEFMSVVRFFFFHPDRVPRSSSLPLMPRIYRDILAPQRDL